MSDYNELEPTHTTYDHNFLDKMYEAGMKFQEKFDITKVEQKTQQKPSLKEKWKNQMNKMFKKKQ